MPLRAFKGSERILNVLWLLALKALKALDPDTVSGSRALRPLKLRAIIGNHKDLGLPTGNHRELGAIIGNHKDFV